MKTFATPLEPIAAWESLRAAWRAYRAGKRRRPEVAGFEIDADRRLLRLSRQLLAGRYRHGRYRLMAIREPKARLIAVAPVRDRVVHTAVHRALAPGFDRAMIADTYACIPGRGQHRALFRFLECQRRFCRQLHLDILGYYPHVDHAILRGLLAPRLRDPRVVGLIDEILTSGWELYRRPRVRGFFNLEPLEEESRPQGLPIGNLTSQWWGNLYLNGLDHFIKRHLKVKGYLRYMDDFVLFGNDRAHLEACRTAIAAWLAINRRLRLKNEQAPVKPCRQPHVFLGYRVTRAGYDLAPQTRKRLAQTLKKRVRQSRQKMEATLIAWRGALL